ncbi:hypothetical protein AB0F18_26745 [Streptomyces sp. NPDC029216]|uniref:hypothetical protein n=1 Tax=Streptomyces sp. NPDC029216 TaxID=3154701 RepID=UPI0033F3A97C
MTENLLAGDAPARRAFVAPLVSTLLTLPMALLSLFYAGMSPMACDSCDTQAAHAFDASFQTAWPVFMAGLVGVLVLLVWCWALPWRVRNAARRVGLAFAAPGLVVLNTAVFSVLLDWP